MEKVKKALNHIFIDGLSGMALGLFATLIIGTIIQQIGNLIGGTVGDTLYLFGKAASVMTSAGIGVGVAYKFKEPVYVTLSAATAGMIGGYASKILAGTLIGEGGVVVLAVTPFVLKFASLNDEAMHYLKYMLLINSYYIMGSAVNTALIAGVFRAGGDTKFGLICDTVDMWVYAVPLGFFAAFVLKLPVLWVYFLLCTDEFVKWPWVISHYRKGTWAKNITREDLFEQ